MSTRRSKPFDNQWSSDPAADDIEPLHPAVAGAMADALVAIAGKDPATGDQEAPPHKPRAIKLDFEFSADDKATIGLAVMLHHAINRRLGKTTAAEDGQALVEMVKAWYKPAANELAEKGIIS